VNERDIFIAAVQIADPANRAAYLDKACADAPDLRRRADALLDAFEQAGSFLQQAPDQEATSDLPPPRSSVAGNPVDLAGAMVGPYKLLEQIGEGGFGLVFMAEQQQPVRRKVALKILRPGMDTRQVIARFEAERQALALMDHPNIASVLDAGETGSGHPHFVMELVRGVPITDYCDQNRLTTGERLALFTHVGHAVQHAHQKGIIHRDLKPTNVMVTQHDGVPVVKVIDFGVAKALGQQLTDKTLFTGFAQMVGTPLYMSPEQAQLSGLDIDTRSDIYSLGVLLYELLAGVTPFDRERMRTVGYDEMRRIIREEDPPSPSTRLSTLGQAAMTVSAERQSDPKRLCRLLRGELDWIVMKALDKDRNRRYETANELARDVDRYLHDEPVLACPPSAWYRFGKFTRRHKSGLRITAAAALVLLLAGAGTSWALRDQAARRRELSDRRAETEQTVSAALIKTQQLRKQAGEAPSATSQEAEAAVALWGQAEASLDQAETALRTGTADARLRHRVSVVQERIEQGHAQARRKANLLRDLDDAHMSRSIWINNSFDFGGASTQYAASFAAYGLEVKPGRTEALAQRIRAEEPAIREALIVALEDWHVSAVEAKTSELAKLVGAIVAAADDDPWRRQYRAAATAKDATALRALSGQARRLSLPPSSLVLLASHLYGRGDRDEALALMRWARSRHLTDFWIHFDMGGLLLSGEDKSPVILEEAIGCFRTALALRPATSAAHVNLGGALQFKNQLDEAIAEFKKAVELDPTLAPAHHNLGLALMIQNQLDEAMAQFRQAIKLNDKLPHAHSALGFALQAKNQLDEAIAEYRKAIDLDPKFAPAHSGLGFALGAKNQLDEAIGEYKKAIELDPKFAPAHYGLGFALQAKNQLDEAITEFRKVIDLDPKFAAAHNRLGFALEATNQLNQAIGEYKKAIELDPKLATAHYGLGLALRAKNQWDEAIGELKKAIELDPKNALAHHNLGLALQAKNQLDEAIGELKRAIELDPKNALAHHNLGFTLQAKNKLDEAIGEYKNAIELDPKNARAHFNLGTALSRKHQSDEAISEYRKAVDLDPTLARAHHSLGVELQTTNRLDEAIGEYKQAIELDPKNARAHFDLGRALGAKDQWDEAIAEFRRVIDLQTDYYAEAHCNLARILRLQGQLSASLDFYQRGHASGSKRKDWRYPSAQWVSDAERLVRLEAKLADVLAGKGTATENGERLGLLEVCRLERRHAAAARLYADAFTADPKLAGDRKASHRYIAACAAALAAAGQGTDAGKLNDQERRLLRQQALAWLRADLDALSNRSESSQPAERQATRQMVQRWQRDADLARVRDADALQKLPADEQQAWRKLWADLAELLKKAEAAQLLGVKDKEH